jgi:peptide/nickel transport system ATP-binding protein
MAMVFQDPMTSLNPVVTIGRQLTEHVRYHLDMGKKEARRSRRRAAQVGPHPRGREAVRRVPAPDVGRHAPARVHRHRARLRPRMLFADEPTTALDVTVQHQILNLLAEQQRDRAMAMILVTHDLGVVAGRTDEIMVMYAGKVVEKAPTRSSSPRCATPTPRACSGRSPRSPRPSTPGSTPSRSTAEPDRPATRLQVRAPLRLRAGHLPRGGAPVAIDRFPDHVFACHFPVGTPENEAAFEANIAAEYPPALAAAGKLRQRRGGGLMAGSGTAHLRPADEVLLQVTDLVVEFPVGKGRTVKAVSGISFDIAKGETLGLVGESGCGKSTTGRAILQLPKPTGGSVVLDGEDLARSTTRRCGSGAPAADDLPGSDLVAEPAPDDRRGRRRAAQRVGPKNKDEQWNIVARILDQVGVDPGPARYKRPHEFSGGQCQRISIARALVMEPQ